MRQRSWVKGFLNSLAATALYAVVHSIFASRKAKCAAKALVGSRYRNALYRPFYLAQSGLTMALLVTYIRRQPGRVIWELRGVRALPFQLVQISGLCWASYAAFEVGLAEILGIRPALDLARGRKLIAPEPEAQGPALEVNRAQDGEMISPDLRIQGPFRLTRHPLNFAPLAIMWFNPKMTTNLLAYDILSTVYLVLGSKFEELRLESAYGPAYTRYRQSGVPFYLPH